MVNIDREEYQGHIGTALHRVGFCLNQIENEKGFSLGVNWDSEIVPHLSVEEIIGALVSAEQVLLLETSDGELCKLCDCYEDHLKILKNGCRSLLFGSECYYKTHPGCNSPNGCLNLRLRRFS